MPPKVLEAAGRVRELGGVRADSIVHAVGKVADRLGIAIRPGAARHCVATWAVDAGATYEQVAAYLGHKSSRTTRRHYATHAVPVRPKGI